MKRVVVESPCAAPTLALRERNRLYAYACVAHSLSLGEAPYASHIFYDRPRLLNDAVPGERELGIAAGLAWSERGDLVVLYTDLGVSAGMARGREQAVRLGQGWTERRLPAELFRAFEATAREASDAREAHNAPPFTDTQAFDEVDAPAHYIAGRKFQPLDVIADWGLDFLTGTVVHYLSRAGRKPGCSRLQDLQKANMLLERVIRAEENKPT